MRVGRRYVEQVSSYHPIVRVAFVSFAAVAAVAVTAAGAAAAASGTALAAAVAITIADARRRERALEFLQLESEKLALANRDNAQFLRSVRVRVSEAENPKPPCTICTPRMR